MTEEEFNHLARMCRISCTEEEKKKLLGSITQILAYIDLMKEVDTTGVPSCNTVNETLCNVLRADVPGEVLPRDLFLSNAPAHTGGMVRVPPVLKP